MSNALLALKRRLVRTRWLSDRFPDELYLRWCYEVQLRRRPNLAQPTTFNEKLGWLKLHWRDPRCPVCVDKLAVRGYVEERCGPDLLNTLHAVYQRAEELDPATLPDAFVLRATHASGFNLLCPDRRGFDPEAARASMRRWLRNGWGRATREWPYYDVPRRVVCERWLGCEGRPPDDYKLFCFDGEPRLVEVHTGKGTDFRMALHDLEWNQLPIELEHPLPDVPAPRPALLPEMLLRARQLAAGFPFVRVDLYQVDGRLVFGELTFFPTAGMKVFGDPDHDRWMGELLRLPSETGSRPGGAHSRSSMR